MSEQSHRRAVIGNASNFWLHSTRTGFDLTHPETPSSPPVSPRITLKTTTTPITVDPDKTALVIIDMQNFFLSEAFGRAKGAGHAAADHLLKYCIPAARKAGIRTIWLNWGLTQEDVDQMPPAVKRAFGFEAVIDEPESDGTYGVADPFAEKPNGIGVDKHGDLRYQGGDKLLENGKDGRIYKGLGAPCGILTLPSGEKIDAGRLLMRDQWNASLYPPLDACYEEGKKLKHNPDVWIHKNRMSGMWGGEGLFQEFLESKGLRTLFFTGVNTDQCVAGTFTDSFSKGYDCILLQDACGTTSPEYAQQCIAYNAARTWGFVVDSEEFAKGVEEGTNNQNSICISTLEMVLLPVYYSTLITPESSIVGLTNADQRQLAAHPATLSLFPQQLLQLSIMGTLTANVPRLAEHCPHKLPTSCRLTATPLCCACCDRRPHSTTYSVYVDGVGFVQRGTRWQNYCWYCKIFWENRVSTARISRTETRIPEHPDQTEFVEKWFEFHQGYRIVKKNNGREQRIGVRGEPLMDVAPGHLPRTLDDLRRGATTSSIERHLHNHRRRTPRRQIEISAPAQSLDETLDDLLHEAIAEEQGSRPEERVAEEEIRRPEIETSSGGPSQPSTQGENRTGNDAQAGLRERFVRIYGTPEEISSEEYVSPIAGMFNRAWDRHRRFQELRRAQESLEGSALSPWSIPEVGPFPSRSWGEQEALVRAGSLDMYRHLATQDGLQEFRRMLNRPNPLAGPSNSEPQAEGSQSSAEAQEAPTASNNAEEQRLGEALQRIHSMASSGDELRRRAAQAFDDRLASILARRRANVPEFAGLDGDDRPAPLEDEQMTVKLDCKICLSQIADTACLPCGHLSMCVWCADQAIPVREDDRTRPQSRHARCPVCRKGVKQRVKIYPH